MIEFDRADAYDLGTTPGISKPVTGFAENFFASRENLRLNDQSQSKDAILKDLWGPIVEDLNEAFPNQGFLGRDFEDPGDFLNIGLGVYNSGNGPMDRYNFAAKNILEFMDKNQESLPEHLRGITLDTLEQTALDRAKAAREFAQEIGSRSSGFSGTAGSFLGGVAGVVEDPVNAFAYAAVLKQSKTLWRLAMTEAVIGAGTGAMAEAGVSQWYQEQGLDYGYQDFLKNVGINAVASAGFAVGLKVSLDAAKGGYNAVSKSGKANKDSQALADAAEAAEELEADNPFTDANQPPAQAEHNRRAETAEAAVENNKAPAMTDEPTIEPKPISPELQKSYDAERANNARFDEIQDQIDTLEAERTALDDDLLDLSTEEAKKIAKQQKARRDAIKKEIDGLKKQQENIGLENESILNERESVVQDAIADGAVDNLDGVIYKIPARDVLIDAKRFQFKEGGDEYGVTERLQGITEWDPIQAGMVVFWEDAQGKIFIADGHQRAGLARRIMDQDPSKKINLIGYKLRETDGVSPDKARVIAALANISQGTGTVVDAAKVLRVDPAGLAKLPPMSSLVRQANDLVNLSDDAFGAIINEVIPANYGAIVGRLIDDPEIQQAAIKVLSKSDPSNVFQAEAIVRQVKDTDLVRETQVSLFGDEDIATSLYTERAKVLDRTYKILKADKASFENLSKNAERIEAEGNKLAKDQNQRRADQDGQAITLLQALANRKGTLSDDLSAAAREAKDQGYAAAARNFAEAVRRGIERGDFDRAATGDVGRAVEVAPQSRTDAIEDEPTLEGFDVPTGPAVEAQTNQMALDTFRELEIAEPEIPRVLEPGDIEPDWKPYMILQEGDTLIPVSKIKPVKVRPEGVRNAVPFMQQAARGEIDKRPALLVKDNEDGTFSVRDGNSTYTIADQAGWPAIPAKIVTDQEYATEQARKAVDRIFKQDKLGKKKRRFVIGQDLEEAELATVQVQLKDRQPKDVDTYMAAATKNHDALNDAAEEAAKELGIEFKRAPVKTIEKINVKLAKKGRVGQIHTIADAARTGITARSIEENDAWIAALAKKFHMIDEGWIITPAGYFDRKLIVIFDDGGLGEIQVWAPGMLNAKQAKVKRSHKHLPDNPYDLGIGKEDKGPGWSGHDYYDASNLPDATPEMIAEANALMNDLYGRVQAQLDPSYAQKLGFDAPSAESMASMRSDEISMERSLESVSLARSDDPVQPSSGPDQVTAFDPSITTISPSASLKNRNVPSYELTEAGDQALIPGVEPISTRQLLRAASDEPMRGGDDAMPEGGLFDDTALLQKDIFDIAEDINTEQFDAEIPLGTRFDEETGELLAETKTLREIKSDIDAEDALINRLGVCGL